MQGPRRIASISCLHAIDAKRCSLKAESLWLSLGREASLRNKACQRYKGIVYQFKTSFNLVFSVSGDCSFSFVWNFHVNYKGDSCWISAIVQCAIFENMLHMLEVRIIIVGNGVIANVLKISEI